MRVKVLETGGLAKPEELIMDEPVLNSGLALEQTLTVPILPILCGAATAASRFSILPIAFQRWTGWK
jgi:hypothetical protein